MPIKRWNRRLAIGDKVNQATRDIEQVIVVVVQARYLVIIELAIEPRWPVDDELDAIICINMIHISPWSSTIALCAGAERHLRVGGLLVTYGPYLENGTAVQSNLAFDASLKRRNAAWGLRDLDDVTRVAAAHGLARRQVVRMPANNLTVVFAKTL